MEDTDEIVQITSRDLWFKVVGMLQQNWALIDAAPEGGVVVWFVSDASGVFDQLRLPSENAARQALARNGFCRFADDAGAQQMLRRPEPPYFRSPHPNGPIYSSGRFWR
jgi:hypothetical protein